MNFQDISCFSITTLRVTLIPRRIAVISLIPYDKFTPLLVLERDSISMLIQIKTTAVETRVFAIFDTLLPEASMFTQISIKSILHVCTFVLHRAIQIFQLL